MWSAVIGHREWEGREVLGSGSLIGGGRRADMRHLLLWPPIGSAAGVWRFWRCPQVLERSLRRVSLSVRNAAFLFFLKVICCIALCIPKDAQIVRSKLAQSEHTQVGDGAFVLLSLETPEILTCLGYFIRVLNEKV